MNKIISKDKLWAAYVQSRSLLNMYTLLHLHRHWAWMLFGLKSFIKKYLYQKIFIVDIVCSELVFGNQTQKDSVWSYLTRLQDKDISGGLARRLDNNADISTSPHNVPDGRWVRSFLGPLTGVVFRPPGVSHPPYQTNLI